MASNSILKLQVDDKQYEASLKSAQQGLQHLGQALNNAGKSFTQVDKTVVDYVRSIGQMEAQSKTARGRIGEMSNAFVEFSLQYKQMSEEVKKSDVGKALAESIDQLKQRTIDAKEELDELNKSLNNVKMPEINAGGGGLFAGLGDKMSGALQVFAGNMLTKAAGAVANLGSEIFSSVQQGVELAKQGEGIRIAFERLGRGDILDGLRKATHGTVTDLELMKAAVKFNDFKLPVEELGTMLAFAQQKAKDTGQSVDYMVDSIVTGLGRKSLMILDNLGLSATEIKDKMAETGDMTKAVGAIIREQMAKAGDYVETAADRAAQANVSLQNKMEELGRKFAPVEEASSQLWTSMKIGILDVIGGPLTDLLNKLTEAGRLMNAYGKMGGNAKVGRMTSNLASASEGNRQSIYQQQQAQFWKYINPREKQLKDIRAWQSGDRNEALQKRIGAITEKYGSLDATKIQAEVDAAKKMLADYRQAAKQILSPVKADIDTKGAEQNVESLKVKLIELEAQRKKAIAAGDTDLSKNLAKQISQVKSDIKGLGGTTTTTTTHKATPQETAANKVKEAERTYAETLLKNSIRLEAGMDTTLEYKKRELSAQERLFDAYNDAYATYKDPAYKKASTEAAEKIKTLAGEVKAASDAQEAARKSARELDAAQRKLADAQQKLAEARATGSATAVYQAQKNVDKQQDVVSRLQNPTLPAKPQQPTGFEALKQTVQAEIKFDQMKVDETALHTLLQTALQNGLDNLTPDYAGLQERIAKGIDIPDSTWEELYDEINEKLKSMGIDPIEIPIETVGKDVKAITKAAKTTADVVGSIGDAFNAIEDPAAKVMGTVMQAIASVALGYAQATVQASSMGPWAWVAFAATGLATMLSTISAIHSATGYAEGGMIKGNSYSGDNIGGLVDGSQLVGLNAGEVVLTAANQNMLAQNLQGGGGTVNVVGRVVGEDIFLSADRYARRSGRGGLLTGKNL